MVLIEAAETLGCTFEFYIKGDSESTYQISTNEFGTACVENMQTGKIETVPHDTQIIVRTWDEKTNVETTKH